MAISTSRCAPRRWTVSAPANSRSWSPATWRRAAWTCPASAMSSISTCRSMPTTMSTASAAPAAPAAAARPSCWPRRATANMSEFIEKLTGNKLARRQMMDIEVREEPHRRRERSRRRRQGPRPRARQDGSHDRRPPDGKYHDQVAAIEPANPVGSAPWRQRRAPEPRRSWTAPQPRAETQRHRAKPHDGQEAAGQGAAAPANAPQAEAVDKSQLPAFLFRPVPVQKAEPQD